MDEVRLARALAILHRQLSGVPAKWITVAELSLRWMAVHPTEWAEFDRDRWTVPGLFPRIYDQVNAHSNGALVELVEFGDHWILTLGFARAAWLFSDLPAQP